MNRFRLVLSAVLAVAAASGTFVALWPEGFGVLAAVPAMIVAVVVIAASAPRLREL